MLSFKITIKPKDDKSTVYFRIDELKNGSWSFFDMFVTSSQNASSLLILEKENCKNGLYDLIIDDERDYFIIV